jgi:hypothetical protein
MSASRRTEVDEVEIEGDRRGDPLIGRHALVDLVRVVHYTRH